MFQGANIIWSFLSSFSLDTTGEINFEMLLKDASDNACNVPKKGLDGKILVTTSDGLARIKIPLTDKSGNSFFWHEVFGVGYDVDIKFDFSRNIGIGENVELKLYQWLCCRAFKPMIQKI